MVSIPKVVSALSCGFLLCLGVSNVAWSAEKLNMDQSDKKMFTVSDKERFEPGKDVKGQLVKVEGEKYFVRESSGNVVQMHVDATTEKKSAALIKTGDYVNAKVNSQGHATSFLMEPPTSH